MSPQGRALRPALAAALFLTPTLVFGSAHAAAPPPASGQILQEVKPSATPAPNAAPGLTIQRPAASESPRTQAFEVRRFEITGATLLPTSDLHALVASGEGKTLTLADIDVLAARITDAYHRKGYPLAEAYVPAQTVSDGVVRIAVVEARYGAVSLHNASRVSDGILAATLAPLQAGNPVAEGPLDRSLLLLTDIPGMVVNSTLRPGAVTGTSVLQVDVGPGPLFDATFSVDDFGNPYTGRARFSGTVDVDSPMGHGDLLTLSGQTEGDGLNYGRLAYQIPLTGGGLRLGAAISGLDYHLGGKFSAIGAHGSAIVEDVTLGQPILRGVRYNLNVQVAYDHKDLDDDITAGAIGTDRHTDQGIAILSGSATDDSGIFTGNLSVTAGHVGFDNTAARLADLGGARTQGEYGLINLSLTRLQQLPYKSALYLAVSGQLATKNLDSSEQFILGGPTSVRAYDVGALSGDQGALGSVEVRHDLGELFLGDWQAIAFFDAGTVQLNEAAFGHGPNRATIAGAGGGLNWTGPHRWQLSLSLATPVGGSPTLVGPTASVRCWAQLQKSF